MQRSCSDAHASPTPRYNCPINACACRHLNTHSYRHLHSDANPHTNVNAHSHSGANDRFG